MSDEPGSNDRPETIRSAVKDYLMSEFLPGEDPATLRDNTPLISSGILSSIQITQLVVFLEETYRFQFKPREINAEDLDTVERIARSVRSKLRENA